MINGIKAPEYAVCVCLFTCEVLKVNSIKMNKMLIILLAVCLVSTHAFVKRDAPVTEQNSIDKLAEDLKKITQDFGKDVKQALDPDTIKKQLSELAEKVSKAIDSINPKTTTKKEE